MQASSALTPALPIGPPHLAPHGAGWLSFHFKATYHLCLPSTLFILILIIRYGEHLQGARRWARCLHKPGCQPSRVAPGRQGPTLCIGVPVAPGPELRVWGKLTPVLSSLLHTYSEDTGLLIAFLSFPLHCLRCFPSIFSYFPSTRA